MLWLLIAAVTAAAVVALILPLLRSRPSGPERADFDRAVYRDQLAEVARDVERGVLTEEQAAAARLEIERRLLAAAPSGVAGAGGGGRVDPITATLLAGAVCGGAVALYLALGSPAVPDQPLSARRDLPAATQQAANGAAPPGQPAPRDLAKSAEALELRLKEKPDDAEGWLLLGRTQAVLERWQDAAASYKRAMELTKGAPDATAGYGEMLVLAADGIVSPAAHEAFTKAVAGDPDNLAARFYLALADAQAGKPREAVESWAKLERDSPPDAPWLPQLREKITETAKSAGLPVPPAPERPAVAAAAPVPEAPRGPTAADMDAAAKMSPAERQQMIRTMVESLAARLEQNPGDAAGWQRLANAYRVLGESKKADEAAARGAEAERRVASSGGAATAAGNANAPAAPRGPSAADMAAAANMKPEERQQMVRTMVDGLAARLEQNPDDPAGWQRLANAYRVLGETAKADEAAKRGAEAQARAAGRPGAATPQTSSAQPSPTQPPPGPTAHDAAAASKMSPEERQSMVRSMVDGLAARLEKSPDDPQGWTRLARAYRVLGDDRKADEALAKAESLQPNNAEIPLDQARVIIETATRAQGPSAPVPDKAVSLMQRAAEVDPKQPEALWYLGLAEAQRRNPKSAADYWRRLLQVLPPGSEDHKTVRAALDALKFEN